MSKASRRGNSMQTSYAGGGDRGAEARRQRAAGVYAPQYGRMSQSPDGLRKGDAGYWEQGQRTYLWRDNQGGFDSLLSSMEQGASASDAVQQLLTSFQGSPDELADFLERAGPMLGTLEARRTEGSAAFKHMADQANWDQGAMAGYGRAAGQAGRGTRQAIQRSQQGLAAQGLGRGGASSAITSMLQQQGSAQQADMHSQAIQQAAQNRMQSANSLFDAHRSIAQMALGQGITPRINSPQGDGGGMGIGQGAATGAAIGAAAGPWGALVGGLAGAGYGAYNQK